MRYVIEDNELQKNYKDKCSVHDMTAEQLTEGFDPLIDKFDRRILYEMTGRKLDQEDYWDDSD